MSCHFGLWLTTFNSMQLEIGQLHDDVILLQLQESFSFLFYCANQGYCFKSPVGLLNLNNKTRMKWILVVVVKCRHHENGLLARKKIIAKTLACVQTPPPLTGDKKVWYYYCDSNPATPCISCEINSFNVHRQCCWLTTCAGGGGGRGDLSNNTPTGQRKMWKNMKSWFENFNENLVPPPICTSFRLIPLSLEVCLKKIFPLKWKGKKGDRGVGESQKVKGSLLNPKTMRFSSCPCMNFRSYLLEH